MIFALFFLGGWVPSGVRGYPPWGVTLFNLFILFGLRFYVSAKYSFQMGYG